MGVKSLFKKGFGSGLSPKKWVGFDQLKSDSISLGQMIKRVFKRSQKVKKKETFEQAVKRFNLTEADIQKRIKSAKELVVIFLALSAVLIVYTIYQWSGGHIVSGFICFILSLLILAYAFREHFNLFQMRSRRLGCTYSEWFNSLFKGVKIK